MNITHKNYGVCVIIGKVNIQGTLMYKTKPLTPINLVRKQYWGKSRVEGCVSVLKPLPGFLFNAHELFKTYVYIPVGSCNSMIPVDET